MTAVSSASLRSHSSPSLKTTSVETSWSVTTPSNHKRPNFIWTLRPMKDEAGLVGPAGMEKQELGGRVSSWNGGWGRDAR